MSKSMKEAYNILWWKDVFEAWAPQCLWISGGIAVATLAASFLALPSWSIRAAICVAAVFMAAHYGFRWATKRCDMRIRGLGFSEVDLESWGLA